MSQTTRKDVLSKPPRHCQSAGLKQKSKLLDQAHELPGYHRQTAFRALRAVPVEPVG